MLTMRNHEYPTVEWLPVPDDASEAGSGFAPDSWRSMVERHSAYVQASSIGGRRALATRHSAETLKDKPQLLALPLGLLLPCNTQLSTEEILGAVVGSVMLCRGENRPTV